jgi:arabinofuranosyltransferase
VTFPWLALGAFGAAALAFGMARITRQYALAAIVGSGVVLLLHGPLYFHYTSDDAYISYRYARNFADGAGLVWNRGDWVEGYSNFLWVVVLAGIRKLGVDLVFGGRWLGFALAVAGGAGTYVLATRLLSGAAGRAAGLAAALLLAACGTWAAWSSAGLEGPLFAALTLVAVLLHLRESDAPSRPPLSGAVWALVAMTRPDGIVFFVVSGACKLAEAVVRQRTRDAASPSLRREAIMITTWAAGFALIFAPYWAWRWATYGWFFPNTYYAKVGSGFDQYRRGLSYLYAFGQEYAAWLLLLAPLAVALTSIRRGPALYVLALVAGWMAYVVYIGGDSLVRFRFFAPIMPLELALVAASGAAIVAGLASGRDRRLVEASCVAAVAGLFGLMLYASAADFGLPPERQAVSDRAEIGRWLRANVPPTTTIAVIPVGAIPYESRLPTIDMLGLNDVHIAHRQLDIGLLPAGHEKYDSQYVLDQRPDIIILMDGLSPKPWGRADYAALSGGLIPARVDMLKQPRLWAEYEPRSVQVREGEWFDLLVRPEAAAVLAKTAPTGP